MTNPDPQTMAVYDNRTDDYEAMMANYAKNDPRIDDFIAACPKGGCVLDVGGGPGGYARLMAAAGLQVDAIDASLAMTRRAAKLDGVNAWQGQFEDIDAEQHYDGVWASFSLLHAPRADFPGHLTRLYKALKPGGIFFIGMKTGTGNERDSLDRYYEYYSHKELEAYLKTANFTTTNHWTGRGKGLSGEYSGFITIAAHA